MSTIIIGISGVTCGGKTTLAKKLQNHLKNCTIISQDSYFYPDDSPNHIKVPDMDHNNYDILTSLDMNKMYNDIIVLIDSWKVDSQNNVNILVIEGFTVLNFKLISELCHLKYQIILTKDQCEQRRSLRTYDPPDIPGYFEKCVWPEYLKHIQELGEVQNIIYLDGMRNDLFDIVLEDVKRIL